MLLGLVVHLFFERRLERPNICRRLHDLHFLNSLDGSVHPGNLALGYQHVQGQVEYQARALPVQVWIQTPESQRALRSIQQRHGRITDGRLTTGLRDSVRILVRLEKCIRLFRFEAAHERILLLRFTCFGCFQALLKTFLELLQLISASTFCEPVLHNNSIRLVVLLEFGVVFQEIILYRADIRFDPKHVRTFDRFAFFDVCLARKRLVVRKCLFPIRFLQQIFRQVIRTVGGFCIVTNASRFESRHAAAAKHDWADEAVLPTCSF